MSKLLKKHILEIDELTWKKILKYKIDYDIKNNNETLLILLKKGLKK